MGLVNCYIHVEGEASNDEDEGVQGVYLVQVKSPLFGEGALPADHEGAVAGLVLDEFHDHQGIEVLDDFTIDVYLEGGRSIVEGEKPEYLECHVDYCGQVGPDLPDALCFLRDGNVIERSRRQFMEHLALRIFESNGYHSLGGLIDAIESASELSPETHWQDRKAAFNEIAEKAPMKDGGFCLKYEEVPAFLESEADAYVSSREKGIEQIRSDGVVLISGNGNLGVIYNNLVGLNITNKGDYESYLQYMRNDLVHRLGAGDRLEFWVGEKRVTSCVLGDGEAVRVTESLVKKARRENLRAKDRSLGM